MPTTGIGISCRNRPEDLELCLQHFEAFPPSADYKIVISDDSDPDRRHETEEVVARPRNLENIEVCYTHERLGIARNKNVCLQNLQDCEYIFLFDDDTFARKDGWDNLFIDASNLTGVQHMMYILPVAGNYLMGQRDGVEEYSLSFGCMLFITKKAFAEVGYFDKRFKTYGYEHSQWSQRAFQAGLTGKYGKYIAPAGCGDFLYTIDLSYNHKGELPPIGKLPDVPRGSLQFVDVAPLIAENAPIFADIYAIRMEY